MWGIALWEKPFAENERKDLTELCEVGDVVWERCMLFERE